WTPTKPRRGTGPRALPGPVAARATRTLTTSNWADTSSSPPGSANGIVCSTSGCGTGGTTRLAACRARNGHVTAIDLSAPMLDEARRATRAGGLDNIAFEHADAQTRAFPPGGFDAAISRNGVMFFSDPVAAFANVRRALRPRGRLAFSCPQ